MNHELRKKLIDRAKRKQTITYSAAAKIIGITDLTDGGSRRKLSRELGEISEFEHNNGRPLLSAVAIYSNTAATGPSLTDIHGGGFYGIAESLGLGSKSKLEKDGYGIKAMNEVFDFWSNDEKYQNFYNINNEVVQEQVTPPFFTNEDFRFYNQWAGQEYDKENDGHAKVVTYVKDIIAPKVDFWASEVVNRMKGLEYDFDYRWIGNNSTFKKYTWARIFRKGEKGRNLYFTVEINGYENCLKYKLDFNFGQKSPFSVEQQTMLKSHVHNDELRFIINSSDITDLNWNTLIEQTTSFITTNLDTYDQVLREVWKSEPPSTKKTTNLVKSDPPNPEKMEQLSDDDFSPSETDYIKAAKKRKEIGDAGEDLVIKFEKEYLSKYPELAKLVDKVKDGVGYDIISSNIDGSPKHIEVKTTTKSINTPFYISRRERNFALQNTDSYTIYRLYSLDKEKKSSEYYEITDVANSIDLQPTEFRATLKHKQQ